MCELIWIITVAEVDVPANALSGLPTAAKDSERASLRAYVRIAFDLVRGGRDRLIDRLALLGAAGDHVAQGPLYKHLVPEIDRRRITRQRRDHVAARRVVV